MVYIILHICSKTTILSMLVSTRQSQRKLTMYVFRKIKKNQLNIIIFKPHKLQLFIIACIYNCMYNDVTCNRIFPGTDAMRTRHKARDCWRIGYIEFMIDWKPTKVHQIDLTVRSTKTLPSMKKTAPH